MLSTHLFSCIKDPKHLMPPNKIKRTTTTKKKTIKTKKYLGLNVPGKWYFKKKKNCNHQLQAVGGETASLLPV